MFVCGLDLAAQTRNPQPHPTTMTSSDSRPYFIAAGSLDCLPGVYGPFPTFEDAAEALDVLAADAPGYTGCEPGDVEWRGELGSGLRELVHIDHPRRRLSANPAAVLWSGSVRHAVPVER